jgi:hypothetical protein
METLEQLRSKLMNLCIETKLEEEGVHTVSFQPLKSRINQDRLVTERWDIGGQTWLFLAVCDGKFVSHALQVTRRSFIAQVTVELKHPSSRPSPCLGAYAPRCRLLTRRLIYLIKTVMNSTRQGYQRLSVRRSRGLTEKLAKP